MEFFVLNLVVLKVTTRLISVKLTTYLIIPVFTISSKFQIKDYC
jgi:antibiotic biosynthesis monooxygenase (ABM) superfamily enzyme